MASRTDPKPKVVKFTLPGQVPDTRLKVSPMEFHVHSTLLQIYSGFFRKVFDGPDMSNSGRDGSAFNYEYIVDVDDDGQSWRLIAAADQGEGVEPSKFDGSADEQVTSFRRFLQVMYGEKVKIASNHDLKALTRIAETWGSLRMMSHATIGRQDFSFYNLNDDPCGMLEVATLLRHPRLFRECLILSLNPWSSPRYKTLTNPKLRELASNAHERIKAKVADTEKNIFNAVDAMGKVDPGLKVEMKKYLSKAKYLCRQKEGEPFHLPAYYRTLSDYKPGRRPGRYPFKHLLSAVLKNNLILNTTYAAGLILCSDYFLCGSILDNELPWTQEDKDWWSV